MLKDFGWFTFLAGGSSTGILATQAANGTLDVVTTIAALGTFLTLASIAAGRVWRIIADVHLRLSDITDKAIKAKDAVEVENAKLSKAVSDLEVRLIAATIEVDVYKSLWRDRESSGPSDTDAPV